MAQDLERLQLELIRSEVDLRFRLLLFGVQLGSIAGATGAAALNRLRDERRARQPSVAVWAAERPGSQVLGSAARHEGRTAHS